MSIVTVQIGQCGNQIGEKLIDTIVSDCFDCNTLYLNSRSKAHFISSHVKRLNESYIQECSSRFFSESDQLQTVEENEQYQLYARSILIDMENKVVNRLIYNQDRTKFKFRSKNSYTQKKGSGNNWSYGYCVNGPKSLEKIENIFRQEAERCDRLASFFICMSLAGGTGSGVGSYYTEYLREAFPRTTIINNCVWPFSTGEVILQNYNFLLTLHKLYEHSDGIVLLENDILHKICKRMFKVPITSGASAFDKKSALSRNEITFDDLNSIIGHQLASIIQPSVNEYSTQNYLNEIVSDLCASSDFKLLSLNNVPHMAKESIEFSSFQWSSLYKNASQQLKTGGYMDEGLNWNEESNARTGSNKTIALSLFSRGLGSSYAEQSSLKSSLFDGNYLRKHFSNTLFGSLLYLNPIRLWYQERTFNNYEKSLTLLSNNQLPVFKIDSLVAKAWKMFSSRAYIHQYARYEGFEEEDLLNAFIFAEQLIKNYKKL